MTDAEINMAVAQACGWINCRVEFAGGKPSGRHLPDGLEHELPDYVHDLNAMNEAEKGLTVNEQRLYVYGELIQICGNHRLAYLADARVRAEAFLRVKGLWK
jgi:hypothetical protein